jgi:hypothetical protein
MRQVASAPSTPDSLSASRDPASHNQNHTSFMDISVNIAAIKPHQIANGAIAATSKRELENHIAAAL